VTPRQGCAALLAALAAAALVPRGAYGAVGDDAAIARRLSGEMGLLLFRDLRWFRLTAFLQYNLPVSAVSGKGVENVKSLSWGALGVRLQL
jgi:hypothetical protein